MLPANVGRFIRMKAHVLMRPREPWPYRSICDGLKKLGIEPITDGRCDPRYDMCITWNNYGITSRTTMRYREAGKPHLVIENGPRLRPEEFVIQKGGHNGPNFLIADQGGERADWLLSRMKKWVEQDDRLALVCGQRASLYSDVAMPREWPSNVVSKLQKADWTVRYRRHPDRDAKAPLPPDTIKTDHTQPITYDLPGTKFVAVYSSMSAIHAVLNGIPAAYGASRYMADEVCTRFDRTNLDDPSSFFMGDREPFFRKLAWNLWSREEIESGQAFKMYL